MTRLTRNLFIFFLLLAAGGCLYFFYTLEQRLPARDYSQLVKELRAQTVRSLEVTGDRVVVTNASDFSYAVIIPDPHRLLSTLSAETIRITFHKDYTATVLYLLLLAVASTLILITLFSLREKTPAKEKRKKFGSDKLINPKLNGKTVTFKDVAGIPEAEEELREIVSFLKNARHFSQVGATMPKGILLQGPPGTGKTLVARAIAGEAGVPFYSFSGSDFVEMFVGVGASRVRDIFNEAKQNGPCIIFIDEIDAMGAKRTGSSAAGGQDERGQTLNALLVELDGFTSSDSIVVLAATNRPDILDAALKRPGRFDRQINILPPDVKGRKKILKIHGKKIKLSEEIDLGLVARMTPGFTGADLANLINEAALMAARKSKEVVGTEDFEKARDRIMMGVERKGMIMTAKDRRILAHHEAGHAVVAKSVRESDPLHKITIIPRGRALGQTQQLPLNDRHAYSYDYLKNRITILMGGRAAEEIIFNHRTTGCQDDIFQATDIATSMICKWGMSENLGPQAFSMDNGGFLEDQSQRLIMGDNTTRRIDQEIKELLGSCYREAKEILERENLFLTTLAEILLQVETIDNEEFHIIYECSLKKQTKADGTEQHLDCEVCPAFKNCTHSRRIA